MWELLLHEQGELWGLEGYAEGGLGVARRAGLRCVHPLGGLRHSRRRAAFIEGS